MLPLAMRPTPQPAGPALARARVRRHVSRRGARSRAAQAGCRTATAAARARAVPRRRRRRRPAVPSPAPAHRPPSGRRDRVRRRGATAASTRRGCPHDSRRAPAGARSRPHPERARRPAPAFPWLRRSPVAATAAARDWPSPRAPAARARRHDPASRGPGLPGWCRSPRGPCGTRRRLRGRPPARRRAFAGTPTGDTRRRRLSPCDQRDARRRRE